MAGIEAIGPVPTAGDVAITWGVVREGVAAELDVHDVTGRRVRRLVRGPHPVGRYETRWDGRDEGGRHVATGIYFVRLRVGDEIWTRKAVILR